jgi:hypothetical protein
VGTRFSAPVQTGPGAQPAFCTMDTIPRGTKWPGRDTDPSPHSSDKVKIQLFFPVIRDRLKMKIKTSPIFTMTMRHRNLKSHLHKFKIIEWPTSPCGKAEQTVDRLLLQCELLGKERDNLILGVAKTNNWPLSKSRPICKHFQSFYKFIHEISLEKLNEV